MSVVLPSLTPLKLAHNVTGECIGISKALAHNLKHAHNVTGGYIGIPKALALDNDTKSSVQ